MHLALRQTSATQGIGRTVLFAVRPSLRAYTLRTVFGGTRSVVVFGAGSLSQGIVGTRGDYWDSLVSIDKIQ